MRVDLLIMSTRHSNTEDVINTLKKSSNYRESITLDLPRNKNGTINTLILGVFFGEFNGLIELGEYALNFTMLKLSNTSPFKRVRDDFDIKTMLLVNEINQYLVDDKEMDEYYLNLISSQILVSTNDIATILSMFKESNSAKYFTSLYTAPVRPYIGIISKYLANNEANLLSKFANKFGFDTIDLGSAPYIALIGDMSNAEQDSILPINEQCVFTRFTKDIIYNDRRVCLSNDNSNTNVIELDLLEELINIFTSDKIYTINEHLVNYICKVLGLSVTRCIDAVTSIRKAELNYECKFR